MERGVINVQQSSFADGELEAKSGYQTLLDDYLRLKKEIASKKRRMRNLKKKKSVLRAEVRFLRKRYEDILKTQSSIPKKRPRNHYETAPVSYPIMGNKIGEGERVEMEPVERLSKKRKQNHNQTQSVNGRTPKKTVEKQRNHSHSNVVAAVAAAPVSYPIMESPVEETKRVEKLLSKNNRLVVDNTEKTGKKKKRVTWKDQVVPKV